MTVSDYLEKQHSVEREKSVRIAAISSGNINMALELISTNDKSSNFEEYKDWMRALYSNDYDKIVNYSESFAKKTKQGQIEYIEYSINMFRSMLFSWYDLDQVSYVFPEERALNSKMSKVISQKMTQDTLKILDKCILYLNRNANAKILFTDLSVQISSLFQEYKRLVSNRSQSPTSP